MQSIQKILHPHKHKFVRIPGNENFAKCVCGEYSEYRRVDQERMWTHHEHQWELLPLTDGIVKVKCSICSAIEELKLQKFGRERVWVPIL